MQDLKAADIVLLCVLAAPAILGVVWFISRQLRGQKAVPYEPRRPVPWRAVDIFPVWLFIVLSVASPLAPLLVPPDPSKAGEPLSFTRELMSMVLMQLFMAGLTIWLIRVTSRATWTDLGLTGSSWKKDGLLGVCSFFVLAPVVYGLQTWLHQFSGSEHPIQQMLKGPADGSVLALSVLTAVILAPLVEELMFRVALQGWLEKAFARGTPATQSALPEDLNAAAPTRPSWLPIVISSALFAVIHLRFHHGIPDTDPIPLFVLALGLGYVYRQTHRIWPSVVIHTLINAFSLVFLFLQT